MGLYCGYKKCNWLLGGSIVATVRGLHCGYKDGNWQLGACTVAIRKVTDS